MDPGRIGDDRVHVGEPAGLLDVGVACIRPRHPNVLADRVLGEEGELRELGDLLAQRRDRDATDVVAVQQDPTPLRIEEAEQQVEDGRLAAPMAPTSATVSPSSIGERESVEDSVAPVCS